MHALIFIAIPKGFEAGQIVAQTRERIRRYAWLRARIPMRKSNICAFGAITSIMGEREIALGMLAVLFPAANQ